MTQKSYDRDPDRLENEIEDTRSRIEGRLDLLSAQFTPSNLIDRALGSGSSESDGDSFAVMIERTRSNPLSAALIAAGLAGMFLRQPERRPVDTEVDRRPIEPYSNDPAERIAHNISALETQADSIRGDVNSTAGSIVDTVTSAAASVRNAAGDVVDRVTGSAQRTGNDARSAYVRTRYRSERTMDEMGRTMRDAPDRAKANAEYAVDWVKENPLPSSLFALAVGATLATVFAAGQSNEPRRRVNRDEVDRAAAARATRSAAVAETAARQVDVAETAVIKPKTTRKTVVRKTASAKTGASKTGASKAAVNKTAPLLKTGPDTGSKTISPPTKRNTAPKR